MTDSPAMADLANLTPRLTGAIEAMRNFGFYLTQYVDQVRRNPYPRPDAMKSIRYQIDRLAEITDNLA